MAMLHCYHVLHFEIGTRQLIFKKEFMKNVIKLRTQLVIEILIKTFP